MSQTFPRGLLDAIPVIFEKLDCPFARWRVGDHTTREPSNTVRYLKRNRMCPARINIARCALNLSTHKAPSSLCDAKTGLFGSEYQ
jgi:hypothetical protein